VTATPLASGERGVERHAGLQQPDAVAELPGQRRDHRPDGEDHVLAGVHAHGLLPASSVGVGRQQRAVDGHAVDDLHVEQVEVDGVRVDALVVDSPDLGAVVQRADLGREGQLR